VTRDDLDLIITGLVKLRREVDVALDRAVLVGRTTHDLSWDQVADLTGVTARTAAKRWGAQEPAPKDGAAAKDGAARNGAAKNGAPAKNGAAAKDGAMAGTKARKAAGRTKATAATRD
jgi:hypothetical protein